MKDINSLSHSKWRCQYHIVFAPKFRRKEIYAKIKSDIGKILRKLCEQKGVEIIEAQACPDHIHMLVSIPPSISVSQFMGYLKGKSSLMIFDRHANLKYKYGNRHLQRIFCHRCIFGHISQSFGNFSCFRWKDSCLLFLIEIRSDC